MSNYTPIVSYGPKDLLTHGDTNKAIKGVQIDAELAALAVAIATKNDTGNLPGALGSGVTQYLTSSASQTRAYGPTAATLLDITPDSGSFTAVYSGTSGTSTASWVRIGRLGFLYLGALSGTGSGTNFYMTNLPAAISSTLSPLPLIAVPSGAFIDNGVNQCTPTNFDIMAQQQGSAIVFIKSGSSLNWTASGARALTPILIPLML